LEGNDPSSRVVGQALSSPDFTERVSSLFHHDGTESELNPSEMYDLGDLTPQCGRRGDALKLHLAWLYYGTSGLSSRISTAYTRADQLFNILENQPDFIMVSRRPLPCLQVCFYYAPEGIWGMRGDGRARLRDGWWGEDGWLISLRGRRGSSLGL